MVRRSSPNLILGRQNQTLSPGGTAEHFPFLPRKPPLTTYYIPPRGPQPSATIASTPAYGSPAPQPLPARVADWKIPSDELVPYQAETRDHDLARHFPVIVGAVMPQTPRWTEIPKYPVTVGIGLLAAAVTFAWWGGANISDLFPSAEIRRGQFWRLFTSILPHLDFLHLAFNLYWLWIFGTVVERIFGHTKTALLLLLFAVGSTSLDFAFDRGGVGLSGAGYALFGLLWVLSARDERFRDCIDQRTVKL